MITVDRGPEPPKLTLVRVSKMRDLRTLIAGGGWPKEIDGYRIVARELWEAQRHKCCYCERVIECNFYDVEHYRPKLLVDHCRRQAVIRGYWWLAFTWENLLFSCKGCNEGKAKGIQFPLTPESIPLAAEQAPSLGERPLLLDPTRECGIGHIEFRLWPDRKWRPAARNGSAKGRETIRVCMLGRDDLLELYTKHVDRNVRPEADAVARALASGLEGDVREVVNRASVKLLRRGQPFVGLSYDALRHFISDSALASYRCAWRCPR
jgi:hypothetical protein